MKVQKLLLWCCTILAGASPLMAQLKVTLTPNPPGPQPVGTTITWTANGKRRPGPEPGL